MQDCGPVTFQVTLTPDEMLALDGNCSPGNQGKVDTLKRGMAIAAQRRVPLPWGMFAAVANGLTPTANR
jgi:hypothetical protein